MQFVRNQKQRKKWKIIFPLLILIVIVSSVFMMKYYNQKTTHGNCIISLDDQSKEKEDYNIADYFYYGDILNLKHNPYIVAKADDTTQKTLILKNICTKKETSFLLEKFIDRQLDLSKLEAGTYQLLISDKLVRKNIVTSLNFEPIETITQNNKHKLITYEKNKDNMLFLHVKTVASNDNKIDIVVDTPYYHKDLLNVLETGAKNTNEVSYKIAKELVNELNKNGYRAILPRQEKEVKNVYGQDGRLASLYQNKAKYYIVVNATSSENQNLYGIYMENSFLASKNIPNKIMYSISENSDFRLNNSLNVNEYGALRSEAYRGLNADYLYDGNLYIRESGGKASGAATFSENSQRNKTFALNNLYGIYTLFFNIGYVSNENDMKVLNSQNLADLFVKGFKK